MLNGKRILIENCPGLGDLIVFTPSLRELKRRYPACEISIVSYERNLPILSRLPYVDHVYGLKKGHLLGWLSPALHLSSQDYVIFTTWQSQLARLAHWMGVSHRAGVCKEKYRESSLFHCCLPWDEFDEKVYRAHFVSGLLSAALGISLETDGICEVSEPSEAEWRSVRQKLISMGMGEGREYAVIAPFGTTERNIPQELALGAVQHLVSRHGLGCVFVNGRKMQYVKEIQAQVGTEHVFDLCGKTSLMEMAAVIQHARLSFSANSGPMHISCALGTDTAVIFSNDNRVKWQPLSHCFPITVNMPCAPCDDQTERQCGHKSCIARITPEMVREALDRIMEQQREPGRRQ